MTFGKNRVQYNNFFFQYFRFKRYDIYFSENGKDLALYTNKVAQKELAKTEAFFDYTLDKRLIFLVYNKLTDFRQSNIGLISGNDEYNTGGVTKIVNNKVFLYYEGDHKNFDKQIRSAITEVLLNEMLYGTDLKENMTNSTLINLPEWYRAGLISYASEKWNIEIDNKVRDGIVNKRFKKFNRLEGEDAIIAGHYFWKFIADTYGENVLPNIVYLTRINKNVNSGFLYVIGFNLKELSEQWLDYYNAKYSTPGANTVNPTEVKLLKHPRKTRVYSQIKINPASKYIAYTTNEFGQYKVWIYNIATGKSRRIFKREHKLDQIPDRSFPVLSWNPSGRILAFFTEEKGGIKLYYYNLATRELESRNFLYFEKVLDFSFSEDGLKFVFSGVQNGHTDIYVFNLGSATTEQITNDLADDRQPKFIDNGNKIVFSSNRISDTLKVFNPDEVLASTYDVFLYDYVSKSKALLNLTSSPYYDETEPIVYSNKEVLYLGDNNGIVNRYLARFDSTISSIDTVVHYRYFSRTMPITNYSGNILDQDVNPKYSLAGDAMLNIGRQYIYDTPLRLESTFSQMKSTDFRKVLNAQIQKTDSLNRIKKEIIPLDQLSKKSNLGVKIDTSIFSNKLVDINNYVFEEEKLNYFNTLLAKNNIEVKRDTSRSQSQPKIRVYETSFYTNYLVSQVDFNFLNASYQAYTGGAVYYNPGFNMLFKLGTNDLFEDYKIIGGVSFAADLNSNEYLLSFENLKKRLDKQIILHRQVFKNVITDPNNVYDTWIKTITNEAMYIVRWPFSQVDAVRGTVSLREDRTIFLSVEPTSLNTPDIYKAWLGGKGEYIFDNTRFLGINLYTGTRAKVFGEYYKQINAKNSDLWVFGLDVRHYTRIHRTLIFANRFAASTSFGHSPLIYYLGSVDNWLNIFPNKTPTFDNSVPVDQTKNYGFQTLATDMRGFTQNIRNGNNFALLNNELRWPIIRYLMNRPISSNFLNNLQVVGFFDVGSAWTGWSPYSGLNAYDKDVITKGDVTITIDSNRDPIVAGYGFGVRSMLLGYFLRLDWAWGIENRIILPRIFYLSLSTDF
jgi:hypothetical protein